MKPHLLTAFAAVSLVLCTLTIAWWIRSNFYYDDLSYCHGLNRSLHQTTSCVVSKAGRIGFGQVTFVLSAPPVEQPSLHAGWTHNRTPRPADATTHAPYYRSSFNLDFSLRRDASHPTTVFDVPGSFSQWSVGLPHWSLVLLFAILPAWWLLRRLRVPPGHCPRCNYDLRASPVRCPECGLEHGPLTHIKA
jgi:hypothetical protein